MKNSKLRAARAKMHWSMEVAAEKIGASKTSIARWENGEQKPRGTSLDLVCAAYGMSAEDLGLVDEDTTNIIQAHQNTQIINSTDKFPLAFSQDIADRRSFLQAMIHTACIVLFLPTEELLHSEAHTTIVEVIKRPSSIDNEVLDNLEIMTRYYWNIRANITTNTLLNSLIGHFQMLTMMMRSSHKSNVYKRLYSIVGETGQIIGQMLFDMKEYAVAWSYYTFSIQAAQQARNNELRAVGLGRMAQLLLYVNQLQEALSYVQEAKHLSLSNTKIHCWLTVVEAEIYASMQQSIFCFQSIDTVRNFEIAPQDEDRYSIGFNLARVESYIGVCHIRLHSPKQALVALEKAISLCDTSAKRRRSTILTDQAAAYIQLGNIDIACKLAGQALELTAETKSAQVLNRIQAVQRGMKQWSATSIVKELNEKFKNTLITITL